MDINKEFNNPTKPIIALMYDFDKTLCTENMQEYSFIPSLELSAEEFWLRTSKMITEKGMEPILAYMYTMLKEANHAETPLNRQAFVDLGKDLVFFPGVETWFSRIAAVADSLGVEVEHYIISSGLKEIIEGSAIYENFEDVYACEFYYDFNGLPVWPKSAVNYTTKTQFLFRINKGIRDTNDDRLINEFTPEDRRRIPFRNMIYIGDGLTDVPCMKLVKGNGGCSIGVHREGARDKVESLLTANRVDYVAPADYSPGSMLETLVRDELAKMSMVHRLMDIKMQQRAE